MKRSIGIVLGLIGTIAALGLIAAWVFAHFDWNRAKPWLTETVSRSIGRRVAIGGDLHVRWQRDRELHGWRAWIPGANVSAYKVTVGNTAWARQPAFGTAERIEFDLSLLPLLAHTVSVPVARAVAPDIHLERLADGRDNWTFAPDPSSVMPPWNLDLGSVKFEDGDLSINDRVNALDVRVHLQALHNAVSFDELVEQQKQQSQREAAARIGAGAAEKFSARALKRDASPQNKHGDVQQYAFGFTVDGSLRGNAVKGSGGVASVLAFKTPDRPFPLHADIRVGDTRIAFIGTLTDPTDLDALDLQLWLSGKSLAHLYDIVRVTMPDSPPYVTEGHLVGRFKARDKNLLYKDFSARVGESDLIGELNYQSKQPRPLLTGAVVSQRLQFRDLAPIIGAQSADATGKVLPVAPFRPERWLAMDADVKFSGDYVFRDSQLPIHKLDTRIVMDNAVLSLKPLRFQFADGDVDSTLRFDGRAAPVKGTFDLSGRDVQLKQLVNTADIANLDLGTARGTAKLAANGDSVGSLLGAANGELKAALEGGTISKALIETAGLNLPNIVIAKLVGDKPVKIDCAVANLVAKDGLFDARTFIIDTDIARFTITGNVDLASENLDLVVRPQTKSVRVLSLRAPIHVTGPMRSPDISIDKGVLLARGAGAIGLGLIAAPLAAAVPLTNTGFGKSDNVCAPLLNEIQQAAPAASR